MKITKLFATMAILFMLFSKANAQSLLPTALFVMDTNQICQGGSVNFTNTSTGNIVSQTWTFEGTQTYHWFEAGNPPAIVYQNWNNGGFIVSLFITDENGNTSYFEDHVTVWPNPMIETVFPQHAIVCDGDSALFAVTSNASEASFQWVTYDGTFTTNTNINSVSLRDENNYRVRATDERGCKSDYYGFYLEVHEPITLTWSGDFQNVGVASDTIAVCERDYSSWLYVNASNLHDYSQSVFTWQDGHVGSSAQFDSTGMYTVMVDDGVNVCGATSDSLFILVRSKPTPEITITPAGTEFCEGDIVTLSTDTMYSDVQWVYTTQTNQFTAQTETLNPQESGTYEVYVTDEFGCRGSEETSFISINQRPDKSEIVVADGCSLAASSAQVGTTYLYQWFLQNETITGADEQFFTASTAGFYTVQTTYVENGCASISDPVYATCDPSGIETVTGTQFIPYPNPFTESFVLPNTKPISATLVDMFGKVVAIKTSNTAITFDGLTVASGVYALIVQDEDIIKTIRVVKQ